MMTIRISMAGFTLVELIIVIAIVAIIAAVAIPNFINLGTDARTAATRSIASELSSASAENYAARILSTKNGKSLRNCNQAANLIAGGLPKGYSIGSSSISVNATKTCTLTGPSSSTATFRATGIN